MAKIKVLIEGYAKEIKGGWLASSTTTLIEDCGKKIVVDPGANRKLLLEKLKTEKITLEDIDIVYLTHYHPDHALLAGMFSNSKILDGTTTYDGDRETEYEGVIPGTDIEVLLTPGHDEEHSSLVVKTEMGIVIVAADLFWWTEQERQETDDLDLLVNRSDPFMKNFEDLKQNRKSVLKMADWIIPGHGKMFKVNK